MLRLRDPATELLLFRARPLKTNATLADVIKMYGGEMWEYFEGLLKSIGVNTNLTFNPMLSQSKEINFIVGVVARNFDYIFCKGKICPLNAKHYEEILGISDPKIFYAICGAIENLLLRINDLDDNFKLNGVDFFISLIEITKSYPAVGDIISRLSAAQATKHNILAILNHPAESKHVQFEFDYVRDTHDFNLMMKYIKYSAFIHRHLEKMINQRAHLLEKCVGQDKDILKSGWLKEAINSAIPAFTLFVIKNSKENNIIQLLPRELIELIDKHLDSASDVPDSNLLKL